MGTSLISTKILKILIIFIVIIVVSVLVWMVQTRKIMNSSSVSYEFTGTLQEYKDNVLTVRGVFTLAEQNNSDVQKPIDVQIIVEPSTKITRTILTLPTQEELAKTDGRFETDKLTRTDSEADFATLQKDISGEFGVGIFVKSNKNIAGKAVFTADELNYRAVIRPKTP